MNSRSLPHRRALSAEAKAIGRQANTRPRAAQRRRAEIARKVGAPRFIKVSADGQLLRHSAADWEGVYIPAAQLIVARRPIARFLGFKPANAACAKINLCGAPAERSISLREFVNHLLEYDRTGPAIDPAFFTIDDPYQWIWTSDECAPAGCAWSVYLSGGLSYRSYQGYHNLALAVRSGQFSELGGAS